MRNHQVNFICYCSSENPFRPLSLPVGQWTMWQKNCKGQELSGNRRSTCMTWLCVWTKEEKGENKHVKGEGEIAIGGQETGENKSCFCPSKNPRDWDLSELKWNTASDPSILASPTLEKARPPTTGAIHIHTHTNVQAQFFKGTVLRNQGFLLNII